MQMQPQDIWTQRRMQKAVRELHEFADALVYSLELRAAQVGELSDDETAALEGARRWRSLVESGE